MEFQFVHIFYDRSLEGVMKRIHVSGLLWAIFAFAASAAAQNSPSPFVISGETAKKIHDFSTINLATAERLADACERLASKEGVAISISVLDNDGNQVYMHRMDGQGYLDRFIRTFAQPC